MVYIIQIRIAKAILNKNEQGVLSAVNDNPRCVTVWNRNQENGQLTIFNYISKYIEMTEENRKLRQEVLAVNVFQKWQLVKGEIVLKTVLSVAGHFFNVFNVLLLRLLLKAYKISPPPMAAYHFRELRLEASYEKQAVATKNGLRNRKSVFSYAIQMAFWGLRCKATGLEKGENLPKTIVKQ